MRPQDAHALPVGERRLAEQALPHDAPEAVHVGRGGHVLAADLLGRHVVQRAERLARAGQQASLGVLRQAEVGDVDDALVVQQDVRGLHVAVDEVLRVEGVEPLAGLAAHPDGERQVDRAVALDHLGERAATDEPLGQIGDALLLARVEDRHDVVVRDGLGDARLALEALAEDGVAGEVGLDELERHLLAVGRGRAVDVAHAADPEHGLDPVGAEHLTGLQIGCRFLAHRSRCLAARVGSW